MSNTTTINRYDPASMRWSLSDGSHYLELPEWAHEILMDNHERETKQLKAENARLRERIVALEELVADLWEYIYIGTAQDGQRLHDRTCELGIEVEDAS